MSITATGGPEVLVPGELPDPRPGPGEPLVDVHRRREAELARGAGRPRCRGRTPPDDLAAPVRDPTGGDGVAAVFDGVGADTFDASLASLRRRGAPVLSGASSGPVPPVDPRTRRGRHTPAGAVTPSTAGATARSTVRRLRSGGRSGPGAAA